MNIPSYLGTIGIDSALLVERVDTIYNLMAEFCIEPIEDVFVSEYLKDDGTRVYESLFFFSKSFVMEAKAFLDSGLDWDVTPVTEGFVYFRTHAKEYDYTTASQQSRATIDARTKYELVLNMKATGSNCDELMRIARTWIRPRLL